MNYLTIKKFAEESGYSENAIRSKIAKGVWEEGEVCIRPPDGRVLISVEGYEIWVENPDNTKEYAQRRNRLSRSISTTKENESAHDLSSSPLPLT